MRKQGGDPRHQTRALYYAFEMSTYYCTYYMLIETFSEDDVWAFFLLRFNHRYGEDNVHTEGYVSKQ